jgi:hypothetical protein
VWWMDDEDDIEASEYIVHEDHVERFVKATVRLHYAPGINPHAGVRLRVTRKVTVAEFEAQGPFWWTTPSTPSFVSQGMLVKVVAAQDAVRLVVHADEALRVERDSGACGGAADPRGRVRARPSPSSPPRNS